MPLHPTLPRSSHEIERKFLVRQLPDDMERHPSRKIEQGYLVVKRDGTQVRLRRAGITCSLTLKRGRGVARREWEIEITPAQFDVLWPATLGRRLGKTRYDVPFGTLTIEIDIYEGRNAGIVVAEVEFESEEQCHSFEPPDWLGRDVSEKPRYSNIKLATE